MPVRFREAIAALEPLAGATNPDPIALRAYLSPRMRRWERRPQAVAALRQAVLLDPRNVDLYLDFAALSFTHQSFQVGIDMIDAGLTQVKELRSFVSGARGVVCSARRLCQSGCRLRQGGAARSQPGAGFGGPRLSQIQQNNLDQALVTVRAQLKINPKDEFSHYVLAELLSRQGAQPGSLRVSAGCRRGAEAVRLKPDFVLARDVLSRLYLQTGEVDKAIEQCRLALRDNPSDDMALYRLIRRFNPAAARMPRPKFRRF